MLSRILYALVAIVCLIILCKISIILGVLVAIFGGLLVAFKYLERRPQEEEDDDVFN